MKKIISTLWHGIKELFTAIVEWVATLFGMKDTGKYGRVLQRIVGTVFTLVVVAWAASELVEIGSDTYDDISEFGEDRSHDVFLSEQWGGISYYEGWFDNKGYLTDSNGHKILKNIEFIYMPKDGDSIVSFNDGEKYGYFDMRDGHVVVKPVYKHAWEFSDGLAAVEVKNHIKFIDTEGKVVIDRGFAYRGCAEQYVFHEGHCAVYDSTGKNMGIIDRQGNWVIAPVFKCIMVEENFWKAMTIDRQMILSFGLDTIIPLTEAYYRIHENYICATYADHTMSLYDLQGRLTDTHQIRKVEQMTYDTREVISQPIRDTDDESDYDSDDYTTGSAIATCLRYEAETGWYGLMGRDGRRVTPPSYVSIKALGQDLYLCMNTEYQGVILNSQGKRIE